ncbi:MAG: DUF3422 domain-containing protein [Nitrospirota bacterium]|nr:DUF3422 domain-containing protein [Nitrospirota bacterium]
MPGAAVYGSRVFGDDMAVTTSFTPDEHGRERYLIAVRATTPVLHVKQIVETIVKIETYYHLILMQKPMFSSAVDQVYRFEQLHLTQREIITSQLAAAGSTMLQCWLNGLTEDLMKVNRLSGLLQFELSAAVPYDKIVHASIRSIQEDRLPPYRPLSDYFLTGVTGVAEGYQQLLRRIETLKSGFEGIIGIIRTRIHLLIEGQNLTLLTSVDQTTKSQAILQHTVEGLSIVVISYYLSGLGGYLFEGMHEMGWLPQPAIATALLVPVAVGPSFALTALSRTMIHKRLTQKRHPDS